MSVITDQQPRRIPAPETVAGAATALLAAAAVAAVALPLGGLIPLLGGPILALVLGMGAASVLPLQRLRSSLGLTSRYVLQLAIVLLGATISLGQVAGVGGSSLPVMLGSLTAALLTAALVGRGLGVPERLRVLVGVGTGICGASAIAAVSGVTGARRREIQYAISTIFAFNLVAVLVFPPLGHLLGMSQHAFGLWSGTAVNDTSSVLAAGFAYGHRAGTYAVIVKLTRTTMIVPVSLALATLALRRRRPGAVAGEAEGPAGRAGALGGVRPAPAGRSWRGVVPWFLLWFIAASAAHTLGAFASAGSALSHAGLGLTTVALAAVGLSSDFGEMRRAGTRPLLLGALVWVAVTLTSLALQALTHTA